MANKTNLLTDVEIPESKVACSVAGIDFEVTTSAPSAVRFNIMSSVGQFVMQNHSAMLLREYAMWAYIVAGYTNITLPDFSDVNSICTTYDLIEKSGVKDKLLDLIDYSELKEINDGIDIYINSVNEKYVAKHDYLKDIVVALNGLSKPNSTMTKRLTKVLEKVNG